ncbi:MAG: heavy-metal-associated domain-containing protein [archaeon]|nr:heavy-metal-associated domain-containing protein [archaeon]
MKTTLKLKGMHCNACEMLIDDALQEIQGVSKVKSSLKTNSVEVEFDESKVKISDLKKAIEKEGYKVLA